MSVPNKNTTWGEVLLDGKKYGVLNGFHLNDEILSKYEKYTGDKGCIKSTAPWATMKVEWGIENNTLYLTKLCEDGLVEELTGKEIIVADWVKEMMLLEDDKKICKTYKRYGEYLKRMKILHLTFNGGIHVKTEKKTELYTSIEPRNYLDNEARDYCFSPVTTLRMDSSAMMIYLKGDKTNQGIDQLSPVLSTFMNSILEEDETVVIALSVEDIKNVLEKSESAVMASVQGNNVEDMISSLTYSLTDGVLQPKGCLMKLTLNNQIYPPYMVENLINSLGSKLGFDEEEADEYSFIFGAKNDDTMKSDEIKIEILVSI